MPLTYSQMQFQAANEAFIARVEFALLQDVNANRLAATPPAASDVTITAQRDRLGRAIIADPRRYAGVFARLVAEQLIGKATLLDEAVTTDPDVFSAVSAVYDKALPSL